MKSLFQNLMLAMGCLLMAGLQGVLAENLRGPAFTSPSKLVYVGEGWEAQDIVYEEWAKNADLAVTLDQHLYPALLPLIKEYAREKGLEIAVQEGTCGISAGKLRKKVVDIGGFCCPPGLADRLPGLKYHTLGIGALALLVHKDNPVEGMDLSMAQEIFRGRQSQWRALGDDLPPVFGDKRIRPVARLHCKARPGHWRLLLDNEDLFSPRLTDVSTIPDMISNVEGSKMSIGYEMLWMVRKYSEEGRIKLLQLNGHAPTDNAALISGAYPLYRTYSITSWANEPARNAIADDLVDYLIENFERVDPKYGLVSAHALREAGWKFQGNELVGEPE